MLFELALGKIRLSMGEFLDLTPAEFDYLVKGWNEQQEQQDRQEWERIRWQTVILVNPHIKKPIENPKKLIKFPWEIDKPRELTEEEKEKLKNW